MKLVRKTENGIRVYRSGNRFVASFAIPDDGGRQFVLGDYGTMDEAEEWAVAGRAVCGHKVPLAGVREAMEKLRARRLEDEQAEAEA